MKKALYIVAVLAVVAGAPAHAEDDLLKQATQACVFGATLLGITSVVVLYPAVVVGSSGVPAASLIIGNTLFGCGIAALSTTAAGVYGQIYDRMFPATEPSAAESQQSAESVAAAESAPPVKLPHALLNQVESNIQTDAPKTDVPQADPPKVEVPAVAVPVPSSGT